MKKKSNKTTGTAAERELLQMLKERGFWAHKLIENENGAPFDIIAAKNDITYVFEVKDIAKGSKFPLARVEDNQLTGMSTWRITGNSNAYFAFRTQKEWTFHKAKHITVACLSAVSHIDVTDGGQTLGEVLHGGIA
jgi:Holliday junction resolvase